ncbi:unnamed protein product, partial [Hapterophycus canaliculatus]
VTELKADLGLKEKQIAALRRSQTAEYTRKLSEEKDALAERVDKLLAESKNKHDSGSAEVDRARVSSFTSSMSSRKGQSRVSHEANELGRLRAQNLQMREDMSRLRTELDLMENRVKSAKNSSSGGGGGDDDRGGGHGKKRDRAEGARFYEGQAVECRNEGEDFWRPATIDSGRLKIEPLGGEGRGSRTYIYSVNFSDKSGKREGDIPEYRIRERAAGEDGTRRGQGSSRVTKNPDGETVIRSRVFEAGDVVLVRDGDRGTSDTGKKQEWTFGEVMRRNGDGTYRVAVLGGRAEGKDFHPTMVRAQTHPEGDDHRVRYGHGDTQGDRGTRESSATPTKTKTTSLAEEAEIRYAEQREELLAIARDALPASLEVGQEVIAKNGGSNVWGSGIVASVEENNRHCTVEFDFGDVEEHLPCIFVRPRERADLSFDRDAARAGDAILAQKSKRQDAGGGDGADWFTARFERHGRGGGDEGSCYVTFAGEQVVSRVLATRVQPLYVTPRDGHHARNEGMIIPGDPPPPTKPVRAKKHQEGDIVLACIPRAKRWTPALITGVKGRGRYAVEWADGVQVDALLFTHIASMDSPVRKGSFAVGKDVGAATVDNNIDSAKSARGKSFGRGNDEDGGCGAGQRASGNASAAATAVEAVRLRQRALTVGEPVLAKTSEHNYWSPGCVVKADGGGRYDVRFTDGTMAEDLSFLFVRGLTAQESSGDGNGEKMRGGRGNSGASDSKQSSSGVKEPVVGDTVYVLKRGHSPDVASEDMHNRDLWRAGAVTAVAGGRFTVQYTGEEGKPTESRIVAARLRIRNVIRQKAVQKGDAVLALSNIPGRGWMMGAVTARGSDGKYTIAFADGTESDQVRYTD